MDRLMLDRKHICNLKEIYWQLNHQHHQLSVGIKRITYRNGFLQTFIGATDKMPRSFIHFSNKKSLI